MHTIIDFFDFYTHYCRVFPLESRDSIEIASDRSRKRYRRVRYLHAAYVYNSIRKSCRAHGVLVTADPRFGK